VFGEYVHHAPASPAEKQLVGEGLAVNTYSVFYSDYSQYFSEEPPDVWPVPCDNADCSSKCGSDCSNRCSSSCRSQCGRGS
jgi:hypothetical protein